MSEGERLGRLEEQMITVRSSVKDHETRIRVNEKLGYKLLALAAVGSVIGGALTTVINLLATQ